MFAPIVPTEGGQTPMSCASMRGLAPPLGGTISMPSDRSNGESAGDEEAPELRELEAELCRLGGVLAVRVVGDRSGRPVEVHVLSDHSKPAKQTVRDVRAVAQTVFGLELDHRIVSVAQFDSTERVETEQAVALRPEARVRVVSVRFDSQEIRAAVEVVLAQGEREVTGYAEGSVAAIARPQLVAAAALDAVRRLAPTADAVHLAAADVTKSGKTRVALVTVVHVQPPLELVVSGSAVVHRGRDDAIVRAVLDATNRRLSGLDSRPPDL
jgi:hypothetical protein